MISELNKADFYKCNSLVNQKGQLEVKAVIAGLNPGRIFVDNIYSPNSGLIWLGNNDGFGELVSFAPFGVLKRAILPI